MTNMNGSNGNKPNLQPPAYTPKEEQKDPKVIITPTCEY